MNDEVKKQDAVSETTPPNKEDESETRNEMDAILSEFEEQAPESTGVPPKKETPVTDEALRRVTSLEERLRQEEVTRAVNDCVAQIRSSLPKEVKVSDRTLKGYLDQLAIEDKRIALAFAQRDQKPAAWKKVLQGITSDIATEFAPSSESQHDAISSAVRSAKTRTPEPEKAFSETEVRKMNVGQLYENFPDLRK